SPIHPSSAWLLLSLDAEPSVSPDGRAGIAQGRIPHGGNYWPSGRRVSAVTSAAKTREQMAYFGRVCRRRSSAGCEQPESTAQLRRRPGRSLWGFAVRGDDASLVSEVDELGAVAAAELAEDPADVRLRGQPADHEPRRDLFVGEAGGDETQDLAFALGEVAQLARRLTSLGPGGELGDQAPCDRWGEQRVAGRDDADRLQQFGRACVLEQEAAGAGAQGRVDVLVEVEGCEREHARV